MTDLSPEARALIDAARAAERPPPGARQRVHAAVLAGIATGAATAGTATAGTAAADAAAAGAAAAGAKVGGASLALKLLAPLAVAALATTPSSRERVRISLSMCTVAATPTISVINSPRSPRQHTAMSTEVNAITPMAKRRE